MIGRTTECTALRKIIARARSGFSATLVLRGEAGIGKTALLEYAIGRARNFEVLRVTGIESEMELGFAALHQLVQPLLAEIPRLPGPQRAALESAFGLAAGPAPDRFLVGLATLTLLSGAADRAPDGGGLLLAVDDAQWLDQASAGVLAFVARRLHADRVALVFTVRESEENHAHFEGLDSLWVGKLSVAAASEIFRRLASGPVAPGIAVQLAERAGGNPLALVETARELTGEQLAGAALLPDPLPLGDDTQDRYWRKVAVLPSAQREFLLLAAAEPSCDPELFERAAVHLGLDPALARAEQVSQLLTVADRVAFRHPLIRSAVYAGSPQRNRQRVHAAIAAVSDPDRGRERFAWHRAAAAAEPDEDIAALLDSAADLARHRGGHAAAAAFLRRSAELSPDSERQAGRLLDAARAEFTGGRVGQAMVLLDQAEPGLRDPDRSAGALQLRGEIQAALGDGYQAPATFRKAALAWAPRDPEAARDALLGAMEATFYSSGDREWIGTCASIRAANGGAATGTAVPDLLLDGYSALLTAGPGPAVPLLRQAMHAIIENDLPGDQQLRWYPTGAWCAVDLLDFGAWRLVSERWVRQCRTRGALATLPLALDILGNWQVFAGHLDAAEAGNAEGREILTATGVPDRLGIRCADILVPAWRGQETALREAAAAMSRNCSALGQTRSGLLPHYAFAVFGIGKRDYAFALEHLQVLLADNGPFLGSIGLPDAVEAAVHSGDRETAALALSRLAERAAVNPTDWALGLLARCRALAIRPAGPDSDADGEALFAEAIRHLDRAGAIPDAARARLLYGEWLRRRRRRRQAREHLLAAQETFESIGAAAFAERAWLEAAATGTAGRAGPAPAEGAREGQEALTEREAQIARLVAGGATNAEVAAQLFISASTVDYHLRHVYRKLGVSSRTVLAASFRGRL